MESSSVINKNATLEAVYIITLYRLYQPINPYNIHLTIYPIPKLGKQYNLSELTESH